MNKIILVLFSVIIFSSCDKNQQTVSNLEGEWNIKNYVFDSIDYRVESGKIEFELCQLKEEDCKGDFYVVGTFTQPNGDFTITRLVDETKSFNYAVTESGNEIFITFINTDGSPSTYEFDMELKDTELELISVDGAIEIDLEKDE